MLKIPLLRSVLLLAVLCCTSLIQPLLAQTANITTDPASGIVCMKNKITFTGSVSGGGSGPSFAWDFGDNSTGNGNIVDHIYQAAQIYNVRLTVTFASGPSVTKNITITVLKLPTIDIDLISPDTICFKGNNFCIKDLSTPGNSNDKLVRRYILWGDLQADSTIDANGISSNATICHNYPTIQGGWFSPIVQLTDNNGCSNFQQLDSAVFIIPRLPIHFVSDYELAKLKCDSTSVQFFNDSAASLQNNLKWFRWEFGDGTFDTSEFVFHNKLYAGLNGPFNPRLIVATNNDCIDTFTCFGCADNFYFKWDVTSDEDSTCSSEPEFTWNQPQVKSTQAGIGIWNPNPAVGGWKWTFFNTNQVYSAQPDTIFLPNGDTIVTHYVYPPPAPTPFPPPNTFDSLTMTPTRAVGCGMAIVQLEVNVGPCKQKKYQYDTVETLGPSATIEIPGDPATAILDTLKYQCTVKDTVEFRNNSCHYKAFNVDRVWDFDDNWAEQDSVFQGPLSWQFRAIAQCTVDTRGLYLSCIQCVDSVTNFTGKLYVAKNGRLFQNCAECIDSVSLTNGKFYKGKNTKKNCKFSRDSIPKHWYSNKDTVFYKHFYNLNKPVQKKYLNISGGDSIVSLNRNHPDYFGAFDTTTQVRICYTPRMNLWDMVNDCRSENQTSLALGKPDAKGLVVDGLQCSGTLPAGGVRFNLSGVAPSCTRNWVWVDFDSLAPGDNWVPKEGLFGGPNFNQPWALPPPPKTWGNVFWYHYGPGTPTPPPFDPNGWVTIGLIIGNGTNAVGGPACLDTVWYHNMLRIVQLEPAFCVSKSVQNCNSRGCFPLTYKLVPNDIIQDSVGLVQWNFGDGWAVSDSIFRFPTVKRIRYLIDPMGNTTITDITNDFSAIVGLEPGDSLDFNQDSTVFIDTLYSILDTIVISNDSMWVNGVLWSQARVASDFIGAVNHTGMRRGLNTVALTLTASGGCESNPARHLILNGHEASLAILNSDKQFDTLICVNNPLEFRDSIMYLWFLGPPNFPPNDPCLYWRHPTLDCTNQPRILPFTNYEALAWDFDDGTLSNVPVPIHTYTAAGIYDVKMKWRDSTLCIDSIMQKITVVDLLPGFTSNPLELLCIGNGTFYDTSFILDPCVAEWGKKCDEVIERTWNMGEGKGIIITPPGNPGLFDTVIYQYTYPGTYNVTLTVKMKEGCTRTVTKPFTVIGPKPKFKVVGSNTGCIPFEVTFENLSIDATNYEWDFGDGQTSNDGSQFVKHIYTSPGEYFVYLTGVADLPNGGGPLINCPVRFPDIANPNHIKIPVRILQVPVADAKIVRERICVGDTISMYSESDAKYTKFNWNYGDGIQDTGKTAQLTVHQFNEPGRFLIRFFPTYIPLQDDSLCLDEDTVFIDVTDVQADFNIDTMKTPEYGFGNRSTPNAKKFKWYFYKKNSTDLIDVPDRTAPAQFVNYHNDTGEFIVCLEVETDIGCVDSTCKIVTNQFLSMVKVFNVFTPDDGNGKNDVFDIEILGEEEYHLLIYNRWGEKVFESEDKNDDWNGMNKNSGKPCPDGTYYYVFDYKLRGEEPQVKTGTITLIRGK